MPVSVGPRLRGCVPEVQQKQSWVMMFQSQ
jgi:hypothetical protein